MKVTICEAAKALGVSPETVRAGLQAGVYPFGTAFRQPGMKNYTYVIYPAKFREYVLGGAEDEETDYATCDYNGYYNRDVCDRADHSSGY